MHITSSIAGVPLETSPSRVAIACRDGVSSIVAALPALLLDDTVCALAHRLLASRARFIALPDAPRFRWLVLPAEDADGHDRYRAEVTNLRASHGTGVFTLPPVVAWSLAAGTRCGGARRDDWPFTPVVAVPIDGRVYAIDVEGHARHSVATSSSDLFGTFLRRGLFLVPSSLAASELSTDAELLTSVRDAIASAEPIIDAYIELFGAVPQLTDGASVDSPFSEVLDFELLNSGFPSVDASQGNGAFAGRIGRVPRVKKALLPSSQAFDRATAALPLPEGDPATWEQVVAKIFPGAVVGVRGVNDAINGRTDVVYADGDARLIVCEDPDGDYEALIFGDGGIALRRLVDGSVERIGQLVSFEGADEVVRALFSRDDARLRAGVREHADGDGRAAVSLVLKALFPDSMVDRAWDGADLSFRDERPSSQPTPSRCTHRALRLRGSPDTKAWLSQHRAIPDVDFVDLDDDTVGLRTSALVASFAEHEAVALEAYASALDPGLRPTEGAALVEVTRPWRRHDAVGPLQRDLETRCGVYLRTGAGFDGSSEMSSVQAQKKREQRKRKQVALTVLDKHDVPCVSAAIARVRNGERAPSGALAKVIEECKAAYRFAPEQVARWLQLELGEGAGRATTWLTANSLGGLGLAVVPAAGLDTCLQVRADGDDCRELSCHRYADVVATQEWDWGAGTSHDRSTYQRVAREGLASALQAPRRAPIRALQAPMRSGKTFSAVERAVKESVKGRVTVIAYPAHAQVVPAEDYARSMLSEKPVDSKVVHLLGIDHGCLLPPDGRPKCSDCEYGPTSPYRGGASMPCPTDNREAIEQLLGAPGVYDESQLRALAVEHSTCARTVSVSMARGAQIVFCTHAHLLDPGTRALLPRVVDAVVVDEADLLLEALVENETMVLPLALTRANTDVPFDASRTCNHQCTRCSLHFGHAAAPAGKSRGFLLHATKTARTDEFADPSSLIDALGRALAILRAHGRASPRVLLPKVEENIRLLEKSLLDPRRLSVEEHARYGRRRQRPATPHDLPGTLLEAEIAAERDARLVSINQSAVVVRFEPCLLIDEFAVRARGGVPGVQAAPPTTWRFPERLSEILLDQDGLTADDRAALEMLWKFIELTHAGSHEDVTGVLYRQKVTKVPSTPPCGIDLFRVRVERIRALTRFLSSPSQGCDLISGTFPEPELLRRMLWLGKSEIEYVSIPSPVHKNFAHYVEGPAQWKDGAKAYEPIHGSEDACEAIRLFIESWGERAARAPRILVFAASKRAARDLAEALSRDRTVRVVRHEPGNEVAEDQRWHLEPSLEERARIDVSYLRSAGSRGVDVKADLIVLVGYGYPRFDSYHAFATAVSAQTRWMSIEPGVWDPIVDAGGRPGATHRNVTVLDMAEASRTGACNQAMARAVGLETPCVVWTLSRATEASVSEDFRGRTVYGHLAQGAEQNSRSRMVRLVSESIRFLREGATKGERDPAPEEGGAAAGAAHVLPPILRAHTRSPSLAAAITTRVVAQANAAAARREELANELSSAKVQNAERVLSWILEACRSQGWVSARGYSNQGAIKSAIRWLSNRGHLTVEQRGRYAPSEALLELAAATDPARTGWEAIKALSATPPQVPAEGGRDAEWARSAFPSRLSVLLLAIRGEVWANPPSAEGLVEAMRSMRLR